MRSQYTFYKSFDDIIEDLTDIQLAKYIRTINDVQFLRVKIDDVKFDDPLLKIVWKMLNFLKVFYKTLLRLSNVFFTSITL